MLHTCVLRVLQVNVSASPYNSVGLKTVVPICANAVLCLPALPSAAINLRGVEMSPREPWDKMPLPDVSDIPRAVVNLANVNSISSQITVTWPLTQRQT